MNKVTKLEFFIFFIILATAIFFRFYQLDLTPPGLWPDEAANGVDALKALDSNNFKIFYPANNGREGLFINIQALSISYFGNNAWALRWISGIMGTLTIIGLYLLTRKIFNWRIAATASFFMAISMWHVIFSRIGFRAIMLPLILVWAFYFLWRGLKTSHLKEFIFAGIIGGIGFYTYFSFRISPLIVLILFANYWLYLKKDFDFPKYDETRTRLLQGFTGMMLAVIVIALPLLIYFYTHPEDFLKREGAPISIFAQEDPLLALGTSVAKTMDMFVLNGDYNLRHNVPGWPQLSLPIGLLFAIGFIREILHLLRRKHGHISPVHTFLFSWFFIMLLPGFLSTEAPHALRTIGVIPVVMIFAAQGFWWLIGLLKKYHHLTDPHAQINVKTYKAESNIMLTVTIVAFMASLASLEYSRYFRSWGRHPSIGNAFVQNYEDISDYLNSLDSSVNKYIIVNEGDVNVDGVPNNAQTIKYLTRTHNNLSASRKNTHYLTMTQAQNNDFTGKYIIIPLADNKEVKKLLIDKLNLNTIIESSFTVYTRL